MNKIEFSKSKIIIALVVILYFIIIVTYPAATDDATYSVIGSNMNHQTLYVNLLDNKPPAIYLTLYFLSKLPLPILFLGRIVTFISILVTAYFTIRLFKKVFKFPNLTQAQFLTIPLLFITYSVLYQGGVFPLTETFEILCVVIALNFLFDSQQTQLDIVKVICSGFFLFLAFQYKQTAIIFLLVVLGFLFFEKQRKAVVILLGTFLGLFLIFLLGLEIFGILIPYFNYVWAYNFSWGTEGTNIWTKILSSLFVLPLVIIAIPGMIYSWRNKIKWASTIAIAALLVVLSAVILIRGLSFRLYFLEAAPFLVFFVPLTVYQIKLHQMEQNSIKYEVLFYCLFLIPFIFFGFVLLKNSGLISGYNVYNEISDTQFLSAESQKLSCENIYSTVQYWYLSKPTGENSEKSLNWYWHSKNPEIEGTKLLTIKNSCYIMYSPRPIYSIGSYFSQKNIERLDEIAQKFCKCEFFEQKTSSSAICYDCNIK